MISVTVFQCFVCNDCKTLLCHYFSALKLSVHTLRNDLCIFFIKCITHVCFVLNTCTVNDGVTFSAVVLSKRLLSEQLMIQWECCLISVNGSNDWQAGVLVGGCRVPTAVYL